MVNAGEHNTDSNYGTNAHHATASSPYKVERSCYFPRRYNVVILGFIAISLAYMMRANLSIAILDMSKEYGWHESSKGVFLSAFFWGYITTQLIGGVAASKFGAKAMTTFVIVVPSFFTMMIPFVAHKSQILFIICRVLTGIAAGATFPTMFLMMSSWIPFPEKAVSISIVFSGVNIGTILIDTVGPVVMSKLGWQYVFYISGGIGFVWMIFWVLTVTSSPTQMKNIDPAEVKYIVETQTDEKFKIDNLNEEESKPLVEKEGITPAGRAIRILLVHKSFWNIVWVGFCVNWGTYIFLTWLPTYVNSELGFSTEWSGIIAITPNISNAILAFISGKMCDILLVKGYRKLLVRRVFFTVGSLMYIATLCALAMKDHLGLSPLACAIILALGTSGGGLHLPGYSASIYDIAPYHPSLVVGFSNTAGTIPGIVGVFLTGKLLSMGMSWAVIWFMTASFYALATIGNFILSDDKRIV